MLLRFHSYLCYYNRFLPVLPPPEEGYDLGPGTGLSGAEGGLGGAGGDALFDGP